MVATAPGAAFAGEGCPNEQLRAENNSTALPDCRAYEMVTPADKNSALVEPVPVPTVAADGSSLAGTTQEGFAGLANDEFRTEGAFYRFSRTASGWVTSPLNPYRGTLWGIGAGGLDSVWGPAEPQTTSAPLRLRGADGSLSEIGPAWPPAPEPNLYANPLFVEGGAASAVNGVVFTVREPGFLWPFDSTIAEDSMSNRLEPVIAHSLYEYKGIGNTTPSLVGVSGGAGSTALVSQCGTELGDGTRGEYNAVSGDGGTVFFMAVGADVFHCGGVEPPADELFARIEGSHTVAISEPSATDCPLCDTSTPADATFQGASADGSKVFFTTTQPLLGRDMSGNLYEYDFDPPVGGARVVRVSGGDESVSEPTADVQGVTAISEDGSHVYFVAKGVLTTVANGAGEHAQSGAENFYVYERDAEYPDGRTVFIATCEGIGREQSQTTPDGRFLAFASGCRLTPGDTSSARQVFEYDAQTGSLVRVSTGPEELDSNGSTAEEGASIVKQINEGAGARGGALARTMSDDGSFVFFESPVGLTPQALNGVKVTEKSSLGGPLGGPGTGEPIYAENVYEYHDGRVWLIGSDASPAESQSKVALIGTTASGGDVFFRTEDPLVLQDTDTQVDFYDARVGGGFPAPVVPTGCVGDACQGSPSTPPGFGAPSSVVFSGGGNVVPPVSGPVVAPKTLTAAQKLSRALKVCLKEPRRRRSSCEAKAERRYGHSSRAVKSDRRGK